MKEKFYILARCKNDSGVKLSSYNIIKDKNDEWIILNFHGLLDHNKIFYNKLIKEITEEHPNSYLIIKDPDDTISINSPKSVMSFLMQESTDIDQEEIDKKFKEIEKFNVY